MRRAIRVAISIVGLSAAAVGPARAGWLAPTGFESPADSVEAEFSRINLLPPGSAQGAFGLPLFQHDGGPRSAEFEGTFGLRFKLPDSIAYLPSLRGAIVAGFGERPFATMDLQFGGNALRPRGIELLTTRDWDFKVQARGGFATFDAPASPAGAPPPGNPTGTTTRDFASLGLPLAMSAGQNFTFRALQDLVRVWWGGPQARQWQINLNAGLLISTGDLVSFTFDGGITSIPTGWRAPATAAAWLALPGHASLGLGGGFPDLSARLGDWSFGATLLETVP